MVARSSSQVEPTNDGKFNLIVNDVCLNQRFKGNTLSSQKNLSVQNRFAEVDLIKKVLYKNSSS
jgi:hypothetical protein